MPNINPQAKELNNILQNNSPSIYNFLSQKGKEIFYPKGGILKQSAEAKGKKINATIGISLFEDGSPMRLSGICDNINLEPQDVFPYASSFGKEQLRQQWKKLIKQKNPSLKSDFSTPLVTSGLTHALSICAFLFFDKGSSLLLPDKFWGNYNLVFTNWHGVELKKFNTFKNNGFDTTALEKSIETSEEYVRILLNFPNNPSGYTPTEEEAQKIKEVLLSQAQKGKKILVILDDAYFGLVYENKVFTESLFSLLCDLHENIFTIKIDGGTKEEYIWGFRVGCISYGSKIATQEVYEALEEKTAGAIRGNVSNIAHLSQSLLLKGLESPSYQEEKQQYYEILKKRYEKVKEVLEKKQDIYAKYFSPIPFNSGYFMCIELKNLNAENVRQILLQKFNTGTIAIGNLIRVAFSSVPLDHIEELFDNIYNACREEEK